jgi:3alpha(or 20beta)-hydroxysteroid dehydrogenase
MNRLDKKAALITGAASGIGEATAKLFASEGCRVLVTDINEQRGRSVVEQIGGAARFMKLDVVDAQDWEKAVEYAVETFGRLDVLVNNAASWSGVKMIDEEDLLAHRKMLDVDVTGVWNGIRAAISPMRSQRKGSIVNISSIHGLSGSPGASTFVAAKFAVTGLTRSTAMELGRDGIRVNSVHPGFVDTPPVQGMSKAARARVDASVARQPIARICRPEEIAQAVLFFSSDESSYCTGASLLVDGGYLAGPPREELATEAWLP